MLILRKIIFYLLAIIYLVLCPLVILYALGYIVKPEAKEPIVQTGAVYISTLPEGAAVYIDCREQEKLTPALVDKLDPVTYRIDLFKEGYKLWTGSFPVKAQEATVLDKIIFIEKVPQKTVLSEDKVNYIKPLPETQIFIIARGELLKDHSAYNYNTAESTPLCPENSEYGDLKVTDIITARGSSFALFEASAAGGKRFLWLDLSSRSPEPEDISDLFPEEPVFVTWDPSDESNVFSFSGKSVNKLDVKLKALYPNYLEGVLGLGLSRKTLYILKEDCTIISVDYNKQNEKDILSDSKLGRSIFGGGAGYRITSLLKNALLFLSEKGALLSNHIPYKFMESGVESIEPYEPDSKILIRRKSDISIIDFSEEETGDISFEKPPSLTQVLGDGKDIKQVAWVYDASHILFLAGDTVSIIELSEYVPPKTDELFRVKKGTSFVYSEDTGFVYFIDPESGRLVSAEILPDKGTVTQKISADERKSLKEIEKE